MVYAGYIVLFLLFALLAGGVFYAEALGPEVLRFSTQAFEIFKQEWLAPSIALVMVAAAAMLGLSYWLFYVLPIRIRLRGLRRRLERVGGIEAFAARFAAIDSELGKDLLVGHGWNEFSETLIHPRPAGEGTAQRREIENTIRPHEYINLACAFHARPGLRHMGSLPGYFVGLGLLLTFVGLLAALYFAADSVASPNVEEAQRGLRDLLQAATFKFWTSISGLACSMALSLTFRFYTTGLERGFENLCVAIERNMRFVSGQSISQSIDRVMKEQLSETKKINTEVAFTIGRSVTESISNQMPQMLAAALDPLVREVKSATDKLGSMSETGIKDMVEQFKSSLEGSAGQEIENLSHTIVAMQDTLSKVQEGLSGAGSEVSARLTESAGRLAEIVQLAAEGLDRTTRESRAASSEIIGEIQRTMQEVNRNLGEEAEKAARQLGESVGAVIGDIGGQLGRLSMTLETIDGTFKNQLGAFDAVTQRSTAAAQEFGRVAESMREAAAPLETTAGRMAGAADRMTQATSDAVSAIGASQMQAQELSRQLAESIGEIRSTWDNYRARFEAVDDDLGQAFEKLSQGVRDNVQVVQDFVAQLDGSFQEALASLAAGIQGIQEATEELSDNIGKLPPKQSPIDRRRFSHVRAHSTSRSAR